MYTYEIYCISTCTPSQFVWLHDSSSQFFRGSQIMSARGMEWLSKRCGTSSAVNNCDLKCNSGNISQQRMQTASEMWVHMALNNIKSSLTDISADSSHNLIDIWLSLHPLKCAGYLLYPPVWLWQSDYTLTAVSCAHWVNCGDLTAPFFIAPW